MTLVDIVVEPLPPDLVAQAQLAALDATVFPSASVRLGATPSDPTQRTWIARAPRDGRVVGFLTLAKRGACLYVFGIAVDAAHRRLGAGRALLRRAIEEAWACGARAVALHVAVANRAAIALYRDEGFVVTRRIEDYYRYGATPAERDAYEMLHAI